MTSLSLQCTDLLSRQEALVESEMNCSALQAALSQIDSTSVLSDVLAEDSPYRQGLNDLDPDWQDKTAGEIQQSAVTKQNEIQAGQRSGIQPLQKSALPVLGDKGCGEQSHEG